MEAITVSKLLDLANIPADRHGALRRWLNGDKVVRVSTEEVLAVSTAAASIAQAVVEHINSLSKQ